MCFQYLTHPQPCLHAHAHAQCRRRWFNAHRRTNVKRWLLLAATGAITAILGLLANLGSQKLAGVKFDYIGGILEKREWAKGFVLCVLCTAQLRGVLCAVCCALPCHRSAPCACHARSVCGVSPSHASSSADLYNMLTSLQVFRVRKHQLRVHPISSVVCDAGTSCCRVWDTRD